MLHDIVILHPWLFIVAIGVIACIAVKQFIRPSRLRYYFPATQIVDRSVNISYSWQQIVLFILRVLLRYTIH